MNTIEGREKVLFDKTLCICFRGSSRVQDRRLHMAPKGIFFSLIWLEISWEQHLLDLGIQAMEFIVPHICSVLILSHLLLKFYARVAKSSLTIVSA